MLKGSLEQHRALLADLVQPVEQLAEPRRGHRLFEHTEHLQVMFDGEFFHRLEDAHVFAAGQDQRSLVIALGEVADEFNAIHLRHIQVADDDIDRKLGFFRACPALRDRTSRFAHSRIPRSLSIVVTIRCMT